MVSRLYIWSIIFEPLLFFVLVHSSSSGVGGNFSRALQLALIMSLLFKFLINSLYSRPTYIKSINLGGFIYKNYWLYLLLTLLAGFITVMRGNLYGTSQYNDGGFAGALNSSTIRPLFEYVIALYYFFYFSIFPQYFLKTEKNLNHFFSLFKTTFLISLVIGFIDFGFNFIGIQLIPRHLSDWVQVGARFHGLAGEPRDAFVYLFYGLCILYLEAYFKNKSLSKKLIGITIFAALLTQSASGMLGIVIFIVMYSFYSFNRLTVKQLKLVFILLVLIAICFGFMITSDRIRLYLDSASNVWSALESAKNLPPGMFQQLSNIYPLYDLILKIRNLNFLPVLIGSGLGSASAINNFYNPDIADIANPNSQLVRLIYESGIFGTLFFTLYFLTPVKNLTKNLPRSKQRMFILLTLLLLGCNLGHRSSTSFIFLGIFTSTFRIMAQRKTISTSIENSSANYFMHEPSTRYPMEWNHNYAPRN